MKSNAPNSIKHIRNNAVMPSTIFFSPQRFSGAFRGRADCTDCALNTGIINVEKSYFSRFTSCLSYFFMIHLHISVSCALCPMLTVLSISSTWHLIELYLMLHYISMLAVEGTLIGGNHSRQRPQIRCLYLFDIRFLKCPLSHSWTFKKYIF